MAFATTFRHSPTEPVRGREVDVNLDALGVYVDGTFLPLTGGTITGNLTVTGNTTLTGTLSINGAWDGWIGANETWTYASATTFTITGDLSGKYQKGDKLKLTQTTVKYFYVVSAVHAAGTTTVTLTGGSDYSLANATITSPFYSKVATPQGFPDWFNYAASWTGSVSNPVIGNGSIISRFKISERIVFVKINVFMESTTTYGSGSYSFSVPVSSASGVGLSLGSAIGSNAGVSIDNGVSVMTAAATVITPVVDSLTRAAWTNTNPFAWGTGDQAYVDVQYEI